jgi:hypothetical protein
VAADQDQRLRWLRRKPHHRSSKLGLLPSTYSSEYSSVPARSLATANWCALLYQRRRPKAEGRR